MAVSLLYKYFLHQGISNCFFKNLIPYSNLCDTRCQQCKRRDVSTPLNPEMSGNIPKHKKPWGLQFKEIYFYLIRVRCHLNIVPYFNPLNPCKFHKGLLMPWLIVSPTLVSFTRVSYYQRYVSWTHRITYNLIVCLSLAKVIASDHANLFLYHQAYADI